MKADCYFCVVSLVFVTITHDLPSVYHGSKFAICSMLKCTTRTYREGQRSRGPLLILLSHCGPIYSMKQCPTRQGKLDSDIKATDDFLCANLWRDLQGLPSPICAPPAQPWKTHVLLPQLRRLFPPFIHCSPHCGSWDTYSPPSPQSSKAQEDIVSPLP